MEKMPYQPELDEPFVSSLDADAAVSGWQRALPVLCGARVVLRELRRSDAPSLFAMLTSADVSRFISPPPADVDGFERFITWTHRQRAAGCYACFAVTLQGSDSAIGIFQVRQIDNDFCTAEWGFALGSAFWGTGVFQEGATLMLDFIFGTIGVHRLEARASVQNGRGNGALRKLGAVKEGILRRSFLRHGEHHDQALYSIVEDDWRAALRLPVSPAALRYVH